MTEETNTSEEEDDSEFLKEIHLINTVDDQVALDKEYAEFSRFRSHVQKAENRGVSRKQILPFRALTEIDENRKERIGLKDLFVAYCENGNRAWLNPGKGIAALENTLRKFNGDQKILTPIISLLIDVAKSKLSPAAFLKYVILPRLRLDMNWRSWPKTHFPAFHIIRKILSDVQASPSYESDIIANGRLSLARDIILTKYVGGPVARIELSKLSNASFQTEYAMHWKNLQYNNYMAFFFIKRNVLPFLSQLSGKLEANQILELVLELPLLEEAFHIAYPDELYFQKKLPNFSLYPVSFHHSYYKRLGLGYSLFQVYSELLGFTRVIRTTLPTRAGIYLAELIAKKILKKQSPSYITELDRLIQLLPDRGGLYTYGWHIEQFVNLDQTERMRFIENVESNGGHHPNFVRPFWMVRGNWGNIDFAEYYESIKEENARNLIESIASNLNMSDYISGQKKKGFTVASFLEAYSAQYPENKNQVFDYQKDIVDGRDRAWTRQDVAYIDSIHPQFQKLLLMSVLRGIGMHFSNFKSTTLSELFHSYSAANTLPTLPYEIGFEWEDTKKESKDTKGEEIIRSTINLNLFHELIAALNEENGQCSQLIPILGREHLELKTSLAEKRSALATSSDENIKEKTEKAIKHIEKQINQLEEIQVKFSNWDLERQIIFLVFYASKNADRFESLFPLTISILIHSKLVGEEIASGREELLQDIVVENLQMYQIDTLVLFCKKLVGELKENQKIKSVFDSSDSDFKEILVPYSSLKKQSLQINSLDAALNRLLRVGKMEAERAKWLDHTIKADAAPKLRKYKLYTSKSFIDSYYGDMGGICLSIAPKEILRPNLFNYRIADETSGKIVGMFLLTYSAQKIKSLGISEFFSAFAINPLYSVLYHWSKKEKLLFYLWIRSLLEFISFTSGKPLFLAGRGTYGLLSEGSEYAEIIESTERQFQSPKVDDAYSLDIYYNKSAYGRSYMIIDPMDAGTKHAHRILKL
ncbi:hypothetical protein EHQ58_10085 [Leptospira ognonensis]|uniref:Uncharacterized protein n=1 Tax=Leptospira ognonensis TaxID=2484945 RepID=A0A4R9K1H6_9LEPT|nr:hypothetical protein [Leptospira ognonensis]TGL58660.1 hypothetical protein EHQ58_10085 [Leptospira ognonensis]